MRMIATATAVAFVVYSCKSKLSVADRLDLTKTPLQTVDTMYMLQTENGKIQMRVATPKMEHYDNDSLSYDYFRRV